MRVIEIQQGESQLICEKLEMANKALEEAIFKLKESTSESDTRMWRAYGDYRGMSNYREEYPKEEERYRDDFRYRR